MDTELQKFLSEFPSLNDADRKAIGDNLTTGSYKKGTVLLKEGQISRECFFVLKGCIRQYYVQDGEEKTTAFFTERQAISTSSYLNQSPSNHYLSCVEDSTCIVGDFMKEKEMYDAFPKLEEITRNMVEQDYGETQEKLSSFMTSTPEQRYLDLLEKRPGLLQRAPQHQIASYLGIKPESLSRIRKRILSKKS